MNLAQLWSFASKVNSFLPFLTGLFGLLAGAYLSRRADRLRQLEVVGARLMWIFSVGRPDSPR